MSRRRASERTIRRVDFNLVPPGSSSSNSHLQQLQPSEESGANSFGGSFNELEQKQPLLQPLGAALPKQRRHSEYASSSATCPVSSSLPVKPAKSRTVRVTMATTRVGFADIDDHSRDNNRRKTSTTTTTKRSSNPVDPELWKVAENFVRGIIERAKEQAISVYEQKQHDQEEPGDEEMTAAGRYRRPSTGRMPDWEKRMRALVYVMLSCFGFRSSTH